MAYLQFNEPFCAFLNNRIDKACNRHIIVSFNKAMPVFDAAIHTGINNAARSLYDF